MLILHLIVTPTVIVADKTDDVLSIAVAKEKLGDVVSLNGIITNSSKTEDNKLSVFLQDETAGIHLFSYNSNQFPEVEIGDEIIATGKITKYNGLTEIIPSNISIITKGLPTPEPKSITISMLQSKTTAEPFEGQLVQLRGYLYKIPGEDSGGGFNLSLVDENLQSTTLRIIKNSFNFSYLKAKNWYEITAIVSQYHSYQLIPRNEKDVQLSLYQDDLTALTGEYTSTVAQIIDGDTIRLGKSVNGSTHVRLLYIDTPETYHEVKTERDQNQQDHGIAAKVFLKTLIKPGDVIELKLGEVKKDAYGRLLAQVYRKKDNLNVNLTLVKSGFAIPFFISPVRDETTFNQYSQEVIRAKKNGSGIWNKDYPLEELPFVFRSREKEMELDHYVGNYHTKTFVLPEEWNTIPLPSRIFFHSEQHAINEGFTIQEASLVPIQEETKMQQSNEEYKKNVQASKSFWYIIIFITLIVGICLFIKIK